MRVQQDVKPTWLRLDSADLLEKLRLRIEEQFEIVSANLGGPSSKDTRAHASPRRKRDAACPPVKAQEGGSTSLKVREDFQ